MVVVILKMKMRKLMMMLEMVVEEVREMEEARVARQI